MSRVAVIQSNYMPWKGYFDIIHDVDLFVFYDCVQYTKNDWRSRNLIKTSTGLQWLSVPCGQDISRRICDVEIKNEKWAIKHWKTLLTNYSKAPHFKIYSSLLENHYLGKSWKSLSAFNQSAIKLIATKILNVNTKFRNSLDYDLKGEKTDRLIDLLEKTGAKTYVSGPSARNYLDTKRFTEIGVELIYKDYSGYPEYKQLYQPFEHAVSILDLLFNTGERAPYYIWEWRN
jgi:WbqC-like protein family